MSEILIVTNYYPPETGAAANRIAHLAEGLTKRGWAVTVLTPLPNYPHGKIFEGYRRKLKVMEEIKGVKVIRLWTYANNSKNILLRLIAMLSYSISLFSFFISNRISRTVIVQSPPLLVAFTPMLLLKSSKRKLILNVSDLWPLAGLKLGAFKQGFSYRLLEKIERSNYRRADLVMGQSLEILEHVQKIVPGKETFLYRNYPVFHLPGLSPNPRNDRIRVVYAGLLGVAQGIYKLCQELNYDKIELHIYGQGSEKSLIDSFLKSNPKLPVFYHGELTRTELHQKILDYDLAIIPLLTRIYGSVPSKIFELSRLGMPVLYFGGGEGEDIVRTHNLGWIADAGDYKALNRVISEIKIEQLGKERRDGIRQVAAKHFDLEDQLKELEDRIKS